MRYKSLKFNVKYVKAPVILVILVHVILVGVILVGVILASGCMRCEPAVDLTPCENATGEAQDNCYEVGLPSVKCKSTCDKIRRTYWGDQCYLRLAIHEDDIKLCGEIENKTMVKVCSDSLL